MKFFRSPSKRYARRTVGPCTSRDFMLDSRRSTPMLDGYAGSPVNLSGDNSSQRSTSDGRYSVSSSAYTPVSRQPVNSWSSYRPNSAGLSASPPSDSMTKSGNPALRSTLPADYKPSSNYGSASRSNLRSNSSSSSSIGAIESRPRSTRLSATGSDSSRTDDRVTRTSESNYDSMTRRHSRTYNSARVNSNGRRSARREPRASPNESSEW